MADYMEINVTGVAQLAKNLSDFGDEKIVGRIIRAAMQAGARVVRPRGASNARALGLGSQGFKKYRDARNVLRQYRTYGRIPRAVKVGKTYVPKGKADL